MCAKQIKGEKGGEREGEIKERRAERENRRGTEDNRRGKLMHRVCY